MSTTENKFFHSAQHQDWCHCYSSSYYETVSVQVHCLQLCRRGHHTFPLPLLLRFVFIYIVYCWQIDREQADDALCENADFFFFWNSVISWIFKNMLTHPNTRTDDQLVSKSVTIDFLCHCLSHDLTSCCINGVVKRTVLAMNEQEKCGI